MACQGMISAAQIRAARGLLDWSRRRLSEESGVPFSTLSDYETTRTSSMLSENLRKIVDAFDRAGVVFIGARGVTFKEEPLRHDTKKGAAAS